MKRTTQAVAALGVTVGLVACGSSSSNKATGTTVGTPATTAPAASISAKSFTSDFSAMGQLKSVASKGKGMIGVLLPDTTSSARYESFDRPYLTKAFEAAGLSASDFKIDNAQGSAGAAHRVDHRRWLLVTS